MRPFTRREFLRVSALSAAATVAGACVAPSVTPAPGPAAPQPTAAAPQPTAAAPTAAAPEATTPAATSQFQEAPMLSELVAAGELPPVDERLPENPDVCTMVEGPGQYGGTMRRAFRGVSDANGPIKVVGMNLCWFDFDLNLRPSLAESFETNEDASEWTFHLRRGTKWSDGTPFTAEAFTWYWENHLGNETLTTAPPRYLSAGDPRTLGALETPDDFTVVIRFTAPYPLFGYEVLGHRTQPFLPGHYLAQFHEDLAEDPAALQAAVAEAGFQTWDQLYADRNQWWLHPERPQIGPWISTNTLQEELFIMDRNPYFWQVDAEGRQLPYIDRVTHRLHETPDVFNLWIVNGEIDFQGRNVEFANYTLFKESEASGDYRVYLGSSTYHTCFTPNHATQNEALREFFGERNVRIALSLAVNRDEINELLYNGLATPRQYSPMETSPQYDPELSNAYIEYDPDEANRLLDEAGYDQRDSEGWRMYRDGSGPVFFTIEGIDPAGSAGEDHAQMLVRYFNDVGVNCAYRYVERSLYTEHYESNAIEAAWVIWNNRSILPIVTPDIFVGLATDHPWADGYGMWKFAPSNPTAVEPPEGHWIYTIWDAYDRMIVEPDPEARSAIFQEILDVWKVELPQIGYLGQFPTAIIVKNGLHNYAEGFPTDDIVKDEHLPNTQALWWDDPAAHA
jgi:peptide/nickel transport system substrate-binding protein